MTDSTTDFADSNSRMKIIAVSTSLCLGNHHCLKLVQMFMRSERETASVTLGIISVIVWMIAEIPQLITNYNEKSAHGLSATFMLTWIIG